MAKRTIPTLAGLPLLLLLMSCNGGGGGHPVITQLLVDRGGGVTGGSVSDTLEVVVFDGETHQRLENATVWLNATTGSPPAVVDSEATDANGRVIFRGLSGGAVTVSAHKAGYSTLTILSADGRVVALPLEAVPQRTLPRITGALSPTTTATARIYCDYEIASPDRVLTGDGAYELTVHANRELHLVALTGDFSTATSPRLDQARVFAEPPLTTAESRVVPVFFSSSAATTTIDGAITSPSGLLTSLGGLVSSTSAGALAFFGVVGEGLVTIGGGGTNASSGLPTHYYVAYADFPDTARYAVGAKVDGTGGRWTSAWSSSALAPTVGPALTLNTVPVLSSPADTATGTGGTPTLTWADTESESYYIVVVEWTAPTAGQWVFFANAGTTSVAVPAVPTTFPSGLLPASQPVSWKVQALGIDPIWFHYDDFTRSTSRRHLQSVSESGSRTFTP